MSRRPAAPAPGALPTPRTASDEAPREAAAACPVDLSIHCPTCGILMQPEHAHYRCLNCGYRDSCCM
jgi:hypothetical protein